MPYTVKKIDIHVHATDKKTVERFGVGGTYATPDELRAMYDRMGIDFGVLLPSIHHECAHHPITNEIAYDIVQAHPETYTWFCNIDPRMGKNSPETDLSHFINYYKALGAKGVGELCCNLYFDDPRVDNLFKHAELCDMPVIFHIGNMGNDYGLVDDLGLPRLEKALQKFPNLKFIGHSQKFWAEISSDCTEESRNGYPTGKVTPGRVVELMRKYPNLLGDMSAGSGGNAIIRDPEFGYAFLEEFQDRLFYGTDICDPRNEFLLGGFLDEAVMTGKISQTCYNKVCRENHLKLLGMEDRI